MPSVECYNIEEIKVENDRPVKIVPQSGETVSERIKGEVRRICALSLVDLNRISFRRLQTGSISKGDTIDIIAAYMRKTNTPHNGLRESLADFKFSNIRAEVKPPSGGSYNIGFDVNSGNGSTKVNMNEKGTWKVISTTEDTEYIDGELTLQVK